jgi:AcrR family transcriptional regulator
VSRADEIAAAARLVLERDGATGLTMQAVAAEMGIKAPSLYKHVSGKGDIEIALVAAGLTEMGHALHAAIAAWSSGRIEPADDAMTPVAPAATAATGFCDGSGTVVVGNGDGTMAVPTGSPARAISTGRDRTIGTGDGTRPVPTADTTRAVPTRGWAGSTGTSDHAEAIGNADHAEAIGAADQGGAVPGLLAAYRRQALAHPELYRLATVGQLPRDRLPNGLEDWAGRPFLLVTGDAHRAQALWSLAHGMVILELDDRYPAGCDLDRTWSEAASAFSRSGPRAR